MINASTNSSAVKLNINKLKIFTKTGPPKALLSVGYELLRLSQQQVPHDKGTLQNSGNVQPQSDDVLVGYHTPYAARLHEHPEYHFQRGRKGKYLTDPLNANREVFNKYLGKDLDIQLGRILKHE